VVRTLLISISEFKLTGIYRLPPDKVGMIVDSGHDFPGEIRERLLEYGEAMWMFREQPHCQTTRALNLYYGEHRECVSGQQRNP
jgi:hypothetical protein